ncbi:MAG: 50S ribosomal protein L6 [Deltaproteobacteria bacterium]|nr:50S ribosomal protein L6 [Deltaproteobacteria bacterium]
MSRIGNQLVTIPSGVTVSPADGQITVKGPKGTLSRPVPEKIKVTVDGDKAKVERANDEKAVCALHGLVRALLANMVTGVSEGFSKELIIEGVGYRAETQGKKLKLLLGFSHPVLMDIPEGLSIDVDKRGLTVKVEGIDKEKVGQFAVDIRRHRPPEPYKGKGVRYAGEHIRRKAGKAGATA